MFYPYVIKYIFNLFDNVTALSSQRNLTIHTIKNSQKLFTYCVLLREFNETQVSVTYQLPAVGLFLNVI